jgi:hypothetical protein
MSAHLRTVDIFLNVGHFPKFAASVQSRVGYPPCGPCPARRQRVSGIPYPERFGSSECLNHLNHKSSWVPARCTKISIQDIGFLVFLSFQPSAQCEFRVPIGLQDVAHGDRDYRPITPAFVRNALRPAAISSILTGSKMGCTPTAAELDFGVGSGHGGLSWRILESKNNLDVFCRSVGSLSSVSWSSICPSAPTKWSPRTAGTCKHDGAHM